MKKVLIIIFLVFFTGCVMKADVERLEPTVDNIDVLMDIKAFNLKEKLILRIGIDRVIKSSKNKLSIKVLNNAVEHSKYKKKIYEGNNKYRYRICYVSTHFMAVELKYAKSSSLVSHEIIQESTKDDSCDDYMFENYKEYTIKKIVDKIIKIVNQRS